MFQEKDRIREEKRLHSKGKLKKGHIYNCINCNNEIFIFPWHVKNRGTLCFKCSRKKKKIVADEKLCTSCNEVLPIGKFYFIKNKSIYSSFCYNCQKLSKYGINSKDYQNLLESQNNCCAICKNPETRFLKSCNCIVELSVDHCHTTGKVRGLLCNDCNIALGKLKDNTETMKNAIEYLNNSL